MEALKSRWLLLAVLARATMYLPGVGLARLRLQLSHGELLPSSLGWFTENQLFRSEGLHFSCAECFTQDDLSLQWPLDTTPGLVTEQACLIFLFSPAPQINSCKSRHFLQANKFTASQSGF